MIDKATVDTILDRADIVDVVSDFVSLKRRGTNYVGLCPFHNDRRPSFYVSRAKGICKCFSCGHGGSAVNFVMEHEQMTYVEALRYLANKYHIEIHERELTDEERVAQNERESMLVVNEFALNFYEDQLHHTIEGQEIGMSYFRERGFTDESIKKFRLGYSPENRSAFFDAAVKAGYNKQILFDVGLCFDDNRGGGFDRFRGRVLFPIFNIAGKVVAFGGRTLKNDPAKYLNSPESIVYNKRNELYGLFHAKREITKKEKCFIVEGYADVISMHQAGFENVIASSGTALTEGHIHKIHRFTENVTELFDGDEAGVHAALRGVDMLLKEGLNMKVLLLPEPEDPDSFARTHSSTEIQQYIDENETDFIKFKAQVLLKDYANDPVKKANAISDIVKSIAIIPDSIKRALYAKECANILNFSESIILREIKKNIIKIREEESKRNRKEKEKAALPESLAPVQSDEEATPTADKAVSSPAINDEGKDAELLQRYELEMIRYIAKYAMCVVCSTTCSDGRVVPMILCEYVKNELDADQMSFSHPVYAQIFDYSLRCIDEYEQSLQAYREQLQNEMKAERDKGIVEIQQSAPGSLDHIRQKEEELDARINAETAMKENEYSKDFFQKKICSHPDDNIRQLSFELVSERYRLSKIHTQYTAQTPEHMRLHPIINEAIFNWKNAIVHKKIKEIQNQIKTAPADQIEDLLKQQLALDATRKQLAMLTGERVVNPRF